MDEDRIERAARWLYTRIMEERRVWYDKNGVYVPPWDELDNMTKGWWRHDATGAAGMLAAVEGK